MEVLLRLPARTSPKNATLNLLPLLKSGRKGRDKQRSVKTTTLCRPAYSHIRMSLKSDREASEITRSASDLRAIKGGAGFGDLIEARRHAMKGDRSMSTRAQAVADSPPREQMTSLQDSDQEDDDTWKVKMLFDGECPLCMMEVNMLREKNKKFGAIKFVDIASPDYNPADNAGVEFETAMGKIHGIERDGTVLTSMEAFRKFYEVLDMGWVYSLTKYKAVASVADAVYDFWAKYRLPITGRPSLAVVLEERRKMKEAAPVCNLSGRCHTE